VGATEVVAFRSLGICVEVWKYDVHVNHVAVRPVAIVQANERRQEFLEFGGEIEQAACGERSLVEPMKRPNRAGYAPKIDLQHRIIRVHTTSSQREGNKHRAR